MNAVKRINLMACTGTNLKTRKKISFVIPNTLSEKGIASLRKNVVADEVRNLVDPDKWPSRVLKLFTSDESTSLRVRTVEDKPCGPNGTWERMFGGCKFLVERTQDGKEMAVFETGDDKTVPLKRPVPYWALKFKPGPEGPMR